MNYTIFLFLLFISFTPKVNAQDYTLEEKNNTGIQLQVYKTEYYPDSTKAYGSFQSPKGTSGGLLSELRVIRIDYIAINEETKDTVCRISAFQKDLQAGLITFDIGKNTLKPPYTIEPRLRIKAPDYRNVLKHEDPIEIKLLSKKKIVGTILRYDNASLTILDEYNKEVLITPKEIKGIKFCRYLLAYGRRAVGKNCKYKNIRSVKFEIVEQKFNSKRRFWEWVKIE
jgi:Hfq related